MVFVRALIVRVTATGRLLGIDIMMVLIFCSLGKCCEEYVIKECHPHQGAARNRFGLL